MISLARRWVVDSSSLFLAASLDVTIRSTKRNVEKTIPNKLSCLCPLLSFSQRGRNRNKLLLDFEVLGPKRWRDFQKCFVNELQRTRDAKKRSVTEPCMITAKANLLIDPCLTFEQL